MKIATFLLILSSSFTLSGQSELISIEELEVRKNNIGTPVYYDKGQPFSGKTADYYQQENVSLEHHLDNGLLTLKEGFRDGQKIEYAEFKKGVLDGLYLKYFGSGQKYVEHHYLKGRMHGKQFGWKRDGTVRFVAEYKNGVEMTRINYPPPGGFKALMKH